MFQRILGIAVMAISLSSCSGDDVDGQRATTESTADTTAPEPLPTSPGSASVQPFVLCPALEEYREELASIVGFKQDADRPLEGVTNDCILHSKDIGFVRVARGPAYVRSIAMQVGGYDSEKTPLPELGQTAIFVNASLQPHVVFLNGAHIIDVDAENNETPPRETMIRLALRVREILTEANP